MKNETEIYAQYKMVKYNVDNFHSAKPMPRDCYGNIITELDNIFNEGMLEALKFVLDK